MTIDETKYLPLLLADSYPEEDAKNTLDNIFEVAIKAVAGCNNQHDLCAKIKNRTAPDPNPPNPSQLISLLPGLIEVAPFKIDIQNLLLTAMSYDGSWERTKPAMRYLELWKDFMTKQERAYIIKRLMETEEANAAHPLALYSEKLVDFFYDDSDIINDIFHFIDNHFQILPILSTLPILKIPRRLRWNIERWIPWEKPVKTDKVIPVRHVNNFAGICTWMAGAHYATLVEKDIDPSVYGDVTLLYVDNSLIGSMKMYRDRSILGLRTLQDSRGRFPIITNGVYVTTTEITIQAERAFNQHGKWTSLHLDKLPLLPMEFLWAEEGPDMLQGSIKDLQSLRKKIENKRMF